MGLGVYYILIIFLYIGMLNIVISVVSETYERVHMFKAEAEYLTKAELLYDYAMFRQLMTGIPVINKIKCFQKTDDDHFTHLYMIRRKDDNSGDGW